MRPTLADTSGCILTGSTPSLNCRRTLDEPSCDVDEISYSPSTVFSAVSIGRAISRSTTSGEAPGYDTDTLITGEVTSWYSSTARRVRETMPSTTSATIIMVAKTGRLMEMSERNMKAERGAKDEVSGKDLCYGVDFGPRPPRPRPSLPMIWTFIPRPSEGPDHR